MGTTTIARRLAVAVGTFAAAVTINAGGAAAQDAGELYLYNWANYFPPELIEKFEQETGVDVTLDVYDSNETMLAKLQAGASGYDIVFPSGYMLGVIIDEGLARKIDASELSNFGNVRAPHDAPSFDPERAYSAPYMWGTTGIAYDTDRAPELEESWKEFFKPRDALKGKIAALNDQVEMYNAGARYLGIDVCTEQPKQAQQILDLLEAQKPHLAMYSSTGTVDRMIAGEVVMHHMWNGAAHRAKEQRESIKYLYPKEGLAFWSDHMVVVKNAPNPENARTFINWMMAPENAAAASNYTGYMNAIEGSSQYLNASLKNDPAVNMPDAYADRLRPSKECSPEARELRDKVWTRLKS
ncbi:extracellular solute-binding protein [Rhodovibrio salinarum]|uniref:Putrescine-binding periplasmic protein n=1 Tax=Rhodovibrio salinarum TaxID=1087 RepID=A0A934QJI5_9PROT|nr:extracellular solute-binding protein [Rhodovibrio salinarum]MBK1698243.1 spermidine/putrescine ABC transporter substrate-binding protein [Rhodovibrio salinarum]